MAVQADFFTRGVVAPTNQIEELPACTALLGYNNNTNCHKMLNDNIKKLSSEETPQRSELTYNASASLVKKRARAHPLMAFPYPSTFSADMQLAGVLPPQKTPVNQVQIMGSAGLRPVKQQRLMDTGFPSISGASSFLHPLPACGNAGLGVSQMNNGFSTLRGVVPAQANVNQARLVGSGSPSTSGRQAITGFGSTGFEQELVSIFHQLNADTDRIFQLEVQKIRLAIEEERKAFYGTIMSELAKGPAMQWLVQKEAELEVSTRRNAELEHRLNQLSAENQTWINIARNNESIVTKLRTKMEIALKNGFDKNALEEGMGDTDEVQSTCRDNVSVGPFACRVCHKKDVTRLVFPCRHLCICDGCDAAVSACPVCDEPKLSSIPVLFT
ncbi:SBP (S-ribonuclease binding protein) family protein [Rhynchospora pubera]|uniref:SBP (S-ribonuclease binding protein) family protein n=1 Tax=Rhynchospora pubera TaxID=906938 RepID=A0AAV8FVT0_9POAL|nr:SBP (S-ribonuclease binding protein) family protein [Rhynchospora pubera]